MHVATAVVCACLLGQLEPEERVLRTYTISFLTAEVPQFPSQDVPSAGSLLPGSSGIREAALSITFGAGLCEDHEVPRGTRMAPEALVDLIRRNIAEDSWWNERNSIEANDQELVVTNAPEVHAAIDALLASLRARRARMFRVDVAVVPADLVSGRGPEAAPWIEGAELERVLGKAGERGVHLSLTAYNEQTVSGFSGSRSWTLSDAEVNQTGVVPVVNPVIEVLPVGLTVEVTPLAVEGTSWLTLALEVTRLAGAGTPSKRATFFNEIESMPLREESLRTSILLESGRTAVAGRFEEMLEDGKKADFAVLVRARRTDLQDEAPDPERTERFFLRVHDLGLALLPPGPGAAEGPLDGELVELLLRTNVEPEAWRDERASVSVSGERFLHVVATRETHEAVQAWVEDLLRSAARVAVVEIEVHEGPATAVLDLVESAGGTGLLDAAWLQSPSGQALRRRLHASVQGRVGGRMVARGFEARSYLGDVNTVSGGTGFSIIEIADPEMLSAGTGFDLQATASSRLAEGRYSLDLCLDEAATRFGRFVDIVVPSEIGPAEPAGPADGDEARAPRRRVAWLPYRIELPEQSRLRCRASPSLPAGRDRVVEVVESAPGQATLVVAKVVVHDTLGAAGGRDPAEARRAAAQLVREARVFDVRSIAKGPWILTGSLPGAPTIRGGGVAGVRNHHSATPISFAGESFPGERSASGGLWLAPSAVAEAIRSLIEADSWSNTRNALDADGETLVVVQTPQALERIGPLLRRLEARAERTVTLDLALVPIEALEVAQPDWRRPGAPPWLPRETFGRAVAASKGRALVASGPVSEGGHRVVEPRAVSHHLLDTEVNQTGVTPTTDPIVDAYLAGAFAKVKVLRSPGGGWFRADLELGRTDLLDGAESRSTTIGPIELIRERQERIAATIVLPEGRTAVAAVLAGPVDGVSGPASFAALVRVTSAPAQDDVPGEVPGEGIAAIDAGLVLEPIPEHRMVPSMDPRSWWRSSAFRDGSPPDDDDARGLLSPAALDRLVAGSVLAAGGRRSVRYRAGGTILLDGTGVDLAAVRKSLDRAAWARSTLLVVDVWQGTLTSDELAALGESGVLLDGEWSERMATASGLRLRAVCLAGTTAALASVVSRNYVGDLAKVSGGSDGRVKEASDPEVWRVGEGLVLNATASLVPGSTWAQLRLEGEAARAPKFQRRAWSRQSSIVELREGKPKGEELDAVGERLTIDLPDEDTDRWEHFVTVPLGRPALLNALPDPSRPGTSRVLIATVHRHAIP